MTRLAPSAGLLAIALALACPPSSPVGARGSDRGLVYPSAVNGRVVVSQEGPFRVLKFENETTTQTLIDPQKPTQLLSDYARAMMLGFCLQEAVPRALDRYRVLMIGLGGGAIPRFLRHHFPAMRIDAVELDPVVVKVAKEHFFVKEDPVYRIHVGDGRKFVEEASQRYDTLLLDAFGGSSDDVPWELTSIEFLRAVSKRLAPKGLVAANFIFTGKQRLAEIVKTYEAVFRHVFRFQIHGANLGNVIILASNEPAHAAALGELSARAQAFAKTIGDEIQLLPYVKTLAPGGLDVEAAAVIRDRR